MGVVNGKDRVLLPKPKPFVMLQPCQSVGMLASVRSIDEARFIINEPIDILDLKEPSKGALGAVDDFTVRNIVKTINGRMTISATIGDIVEMDPALISQRVQAMVAMKVDIIKVGFFPSPLIEQCIEQLSKYTNCGTKIVAVIFADLNEIDLTLLAIFAEKGFYGVMIDTAAKGNGSLLHYISIEKLSAFIEECHRLKLISGLAGSLKKEDVSILQPLRPVYLGFRSALCGDGRNGDIDLVKVRTIRQELLK